MSYTRIFLGVIIYALAIHGLFIMINGFIDIPNSWICQG